MSKSETITEEKITNLAAETLVGDIRDFLLDRVKNLKRPWPAMSEAEQGDQIVQAKMAAETLVKKAVHIIAAEGRKVIVGQLVQVAVKDAIKAVIEVAKSNEQRHELIDSVSQDVLVVVADAEPFTGEKEPAKPDPDQGDLIAGVEKLKKKNKNVVEINQ